VRRHHMGKRTDGWRQARCSAFSLALCGTAAPKRLINVGSASVAPVRR
jgi:hypothetical protein